MERGGERTIYGVQPVLEALQSERSDVQCVFLATGLDGALPRKVRALAERMGVPVRTQGRAELERRCGSEHHQGVVAVVLAAARADLHSLLQPSAHELVVVADGVQDPRNLGSLLRCTEFAGGAAVVVPKHGASGLSGVVAKSSAGASEHVPLVQVTNVARALETLKAAGYWCYGTVAERGESLFSVRFHSPTVIVVGGEHKGIRPLVASRCDALVTVPRYGRVESLNVANAAAVVLMELRRQQTARARAVGAGLDPARQREAEGEEGDGPPPA